MSIFQYRHSQYVMYITEASEERFMLMKVTAQKLQPVWMKDCKWAGMWLKKVLLLPSTCLCVYDILNHHALLVTVLDYRVWRKERDWHFHNLTWTLNLTLCCLIPSTAQHLKEPLSSFWWGKWIHPFSLWKSSSLKSTIWLRMIGNLMLLIINHFVALLHSDHV